MTVRSLHAAPPLIWVSSLTGTIAFGLTVVLGQKQHTAALVWTQVGLEWGREKRWHPKILWGLSLHSGKACSLHARASHMRHDAEGSSFVTTV